MSVITPYRVAYSALSISGAAFIVYEQNAQWYELKRSTYEPAPICGARRKNGERCRSKDLYRGGKCRFHGGLSTGARTPEGKQRAIAAMRAGYKRWLMSKRADQSARVAL